MDKSISHKGFFLPMVRFVPGMEVRAEVGELTLRLGSLEEDGYLSRSDLEGSFMVSVHE